MPVGSRAYPSNTLESGWIPSPLPAIYTGEAERGYREWLPPTATRRPAPLAGSFVSDRHRGLLPHPVGARLRLVRQVRPRLHRPRRARADRPGPQRRKVTLAWNAEDLGQVLASAARRRRSAVQVLRPAARQLRLGELRLGRRRGRHGRRLLDVHRLQRERAPRPVARDRRSRACPMARSCASSGASRTAAAGRRPSSRTSRPRCAPSSAPCRTRRSPGPSTTAGWRTGYQGDAAGAR